MKKHPTSRAERKSGFTLIELSIVLVIIGLIVGGVLVGQDLIKAAEVRATVAQYEKTNSAINTFRTKYNGIPGDLVATQATAFGIFALSGTTGYGNGDGLVTDQNGASVLAVGEPLVFWRHLSDSNLIDGNYGSAITTAGVVAADTTGATVAGYLPAAKIGRGNYWNVAAAAGLNYYMLSGFDTLPIAAAGTIDFAEQLTPIESFNIDIKVDDGSPNTGTVQARGTSVASTGLLYAAMSSINAATWAATPVVGTCTTTGGSISSITNTYARDTTAGNSPACMLRMRFN